MNPVEIKKNIYCLGAVDWNIKNFHGYSISEKGTTYNAYLIKDKKNVLVDTVAHNFLSDLTHGIRKVINPDEIDYLVINHLEPDHAGCLAEIVDLVKPEKIFCSKMGKLSMLAHFHRDDWPIETVETGQTISLGDKTLQFVEIRMLHWPDSMVTYVKEDKLLISSDAFGQNIATSERFDDQVDMDELMSLASYYFANIILPYAPLVEKALTGIRELGLDIDMIAPDHGVIWRSNVSGIVEAYAKWSKQPLSPKAVVVYDTMWHSTEKMAKAIVDGIVREGVSAKLMHLKSFPHSDIMAEVFDAAAVVVGSPTHNNGYLPLVADFLTYMKGLRPLNRIGAAFGSFGWSGEASKQIYSFLEEMKMQMVDPIAKVKHVPTHADLAQCIELGRNVALAIKAKLGIK